MSDQSKSLPATPLLDRPHTLTGYNINKMAMGLMDPANREAFKQDEATYLDRFSLTAEEKNRRAWARLAGNGPAGWQSLFHSQNFGHRPDADHPNRGRSGGHGTHRVSDAATGKKDQWLSSSAGSEPRMFHP